MPDLLDISRRLARCTARERFPAPVAYVYRPLEYAWELHRQLLERHGGGAKPYLLLGMNPGPWGMAQTGVPFGAVPAVRDWLRLRGEVVPPADEHPKRPVTGLACPREEVSGRRLWSWAEQRFGTPDEFFSRFWVANYCPLLFLDERGRNLTPDRIPSAAATRMLEACDEALRATVAVLGTKLVIAVGAWAEKRSRAALAGEPPSIGRILHPSPASPAANRGWSREAERQLKELGVPLPS